MSDVFQEVEEEFRREQLEKLWKKYRIPVIGAAVSLVLAVAGYQGWTYWRGVQLGNSSVALDASFRRAEADDQKAAIESLKKVAETGAGGYAILGKFQLAALTAKSGDKKAAVAAYADIAKSTSDPLFRDLAIVRSSLLTAETAKFEETKAQLEPIAKGTGPWRVLALEMLAYASWRAGKKDEALKMYAEVQTSPGAPDGTKRRALEMVAMISGGMTVADIDKMLAEAAATPARSLLPDMPSAAGGLLGPAEAPVLPDPTKPATP